MILINFALIEKALFQSLGPVGAFLLRIVVFVRPRQDRSKGAGPKKIMSTYVKYPPRKLQSMGYNGPITISQYQRFQWVRDQLAKEGFNLPLPTGN